MKQRQSKRISNINCWSHVALLPQVKKKDKECTHTNIHTARFDRNFRTTGRTQCTRTHAPIIQMDEQLWHNSYNRFDDRHHSCSTHSYRTEQETNKKIKCSHGTIPLQIRNKSMRIECSSSKSKWIILTFYLCLQSIVKQKSSQS